MLQPKLKQLKKVPLDDGNDAAQDFTRSPTSCPNEPA
jgi:hypothetical protein